jgi:exosome complex RNA-binding protein Csl4
MSVKEQALKELLVKYTSDFHYVCSIGREHKELPTEEEVVSKIQKVADKLGWTMEEAWDYGDFVEERF